MATVSFRPDFRTRMRLKTLWLRYAYPFLWAHHPLCERFRRDIFQIGNVRLCRSCTAVYSAMILGAILLATTSLLTTPWIPLTLAVPTILFSHPRIYKQLPRFARDLLRASMGILIVACGGLLCFGHLPSGSALFVILFVFWKFYFHLRRVRRLAACDGCPELNRNNICSGFALQAERVRCYEAEATRVLYGCQLKGSKP